jgi:hypothetical protein
MGNENGCGVVMSCNPTQSTPRNQVESCYATVYGYCLDDEKPTSSSSSVKTDADHPYTY